jgi:hypothetical protein
MHREKPFGNFFLCALPLYIKKVFIGSGDAGSGNEGEISWQREKPGLS